MPIVLVTGTLTPYNRRLYDAFAGTYCEDLHVLTCVGVEPHRTWVVPEPEHFTQKTLPGFRYHRNDINHIYINPAVVAELRRLRPKVMALGGFSPTMAMAAGCARMMGIPYGLYTDGALSTDPGSRPHRMMRSLLVPKARFGVCGSVESVRLLAYWGLDPSLSTVVPLVPAWDAPKHIPDYAHRPFDILFAGTLNESIKGALFFTEVAKAMKQSHPELRVRVTGRGPDRDAMQARLEAAGIAAQFDGPLQPAEMIAAFSSAKVMLFPSRSDPWGLVANEAVQCGTPVLGSPHAVSSQWYVERFGLGHVRPLDVEAWATAALDMIASPVRWATFMARRGEALEWASLANSARSLKRAFDLGQGQPVADVGKGHSLSGAPGAAFSAMRDGMPAARKSTIDGR